MPKHLLEANNIIPVYTIILFYSAYKYSDLQMTETIVINEGGVVGTNPHVLSLPLELEPLKGDV